MVGIGEHRLSGVTAPNVTVTTSYDCALRHTYETASNDDYEVAKKRTDSTLLTAFASIACPASLPRMSLCRLFMRLLLRATEKKGGTRQTMEGHERYKYWGGVHMEDFSVHSLG